MLQVVDLQAGDNMKPEYLALNPQHNIPCVKDGEFVGNESRAVATYLASKYAKDDSLYPKDLETRYKVDQMLYFDMGQFYKVGLFIPFLRETSPYRAWLRPLELSFLS